MFIINLLTGILDCNVTILIIGGWCYFLDDITIILHRTSEESSSPPQAVSETLIIVMQIKATAAIINFFMFNSLLY